MDFSISLKKGEKTVWEMHTPMEATVRAAFTVTLAIPDISIVIPLLILADPGHGVCPPPFTENLHELATRICTAVETS